MRLKRSRLKQYYHKKRIMKKDGEGGTYDTYSSSPSVFTAEVWPASGKAQAEMYGERLPYIQNVRIDGAYTVQTDEKGIVHYLLPDGADFAESDGLCLFCGKDEEPDYKIISIRPYRFLRLEVEKRI